MEYKSSSEMIKTANNSGSGVNGWRVSGYLTRWGELDQVGDMTVKGAFAKSIAAGSVPLLFGHDYKAMPLGVVKAWREDNTGVFFTADIAPTMAGSDMKKLIDMKAVTGVSYGFNVNQYDHVNVGGKRVRRLLDVEVGEVSLTPFPALKSAQLIGEDGKDALLVAEYEMLRAAGVKMTRSQVLEYIGACKRVLERAMNGGRTKKELLVEIDQHQSEISSYGLKFTPTKHK